MTVKVKKRKAGSYRDLAFEQYEIGQVSRLGELLESITQIELQGAKANKNLYNQETYSVEKAIRIMKQDFTDGLLRVFFNQKEYTSYDEKLECEDENELVLIRLVMMAGRLW